MNITVSFIGRHGTAVIWYTLQTRYHSFDVCINSLPKISRYMGSPNTESP